MKLTHHILTVRLLLLFICFFSNVTVNGQLFGDFSDKSQSVFSPFTVSNFGTKHGVPQNHVYQLTTKKNGEVILVTANGIVSYDGHGFDNFISNPTYLKANYLTLAHDESSKVLFACVDKNALCIIQPKFKKICQANVIFQLESELFFITNNGKICVYSIRNKKITTLIHTGLANCTSLFVDENNYYISNASGLYQFSKKDKHKTILSKTPFNQIKKNKFDNNLYGITKNGLFQISKKYLKAISLPKCTDNVVFKDVAFTEEMEFYVATNEGLLYHHPFYLDKFDISNYFNTNHFESLLYIEKEKCLLAGSMNMGLFKLSFKNCGSYGVENELSQVALNSIVSDNEGQIYFSGTNNSLYSFTMAGSNKILDLSPNTIVSTSLIDERFYIDTQEKGVLIYSKDLKQIGQISVPQLAENYVSSVFKSNTQEYWIGCSKGVSKSTDGFHFKPYKPKQITGRVVTFFVRKNKDLCIGGSNGLYILDSNRKIKHFYSSEKDIPCKEIRSFHEDQKGRLWIGTYNGGLYCLEKNKITSINKLQNCKLNGEIFTLVNDQDNNLYMSSNTGIQVIPFKKLVDFYERKADYLIPFVYGTEAGIVNAEFNGGFQNNYVLSKSNHIYFPSIQGIVVFAPETNSYRRITTHLKSLKINDKLVSSSTVNFGQEPRSIEFNYQCPNFVSKYNVHYQFALQTENDNPDWSALSQSGTVRFNFLPSGKYRLNIRAIDAHNDPYPDITTYTFTIEPFWYETWIARIGFVLLAIVAFFIIVRLRVKNIRKNEQIKNQINNSLIELKLKAIQAKMNPHFMFNALNNIQYLILQNKTEEAEFTLSQFSSLLRKFLQQSEYSFVYLKDEIELLKLYLAIENYRFDHELEIIFDIDENCINCVIPTFLIQPVVENALKHGLGHLHTAKKLKITAHQNKTEITITIEDNGVGRVESERINHSRKNHTSLGNELVSQKIKMINDKYNIHITKTIIDKEFPETGMIVTFKIPILKDDLLKS